MTTNAQAALQAAAAWHADNPYLVQASVLATADTFKDWLDEQDTKEIGKQVSATRCPTCGSKPGTVCTWDGKRSMAKYHRSRALASGAELNPEYMHRHTQDLGSWEAPQPLPSSEGHPDNSTIAPSPSLWGRIT